jgi:hypothetical protein
VGDLAPPLIPTCVLTGKPEMRGVGQRTQPLGIRLTLLEPIADLLDHLIKRVQSQMWQWLFAQVLAIDVPLGSVLDCLLKRAESAGARAGESPAGSFGLTRLGLSQKPMPPLQGIGGLWHNTSADIVHDASCGPIMPYPRGEIGREMRNSTLYTPIRPSSKPPTRQHRGPWRQPDGAEERSRLANVCMVRHLARAATAVVGMNIPRAR